jgi:hypothetical protein
VLAREILLNDAARVKLLEGPSLNKHRLVVTIGGFESLQRADHTL